MCSWNGEKVSIVASTVTRLYNRPKKIFTEWIQWRVRVKQRIRSPFPWTYFPLIFRFVWYQQAGRLCQAETERKFIGVSGKRIRDFTPAPHWVRQTLSLNQFGENFIRPVIFPRQYTSYFANLFPVPWTYFSLKPTSDLKIFPLQFECGNHYALSVPPWLENIYVPDRGQWNKTLWARNLSLAVIS